MRQEFCLLGFHLYLLERVYILITKQVWHFSCSSITIQGCYIHNRT